MTDEYSYDSGYGEGDYDIMDMDLADVVFDSNGNI